MKILKNKIKKQSRWGHIFIGNPYLEISYEGFFNNYEEISVKLLEFLEGDIIENPGPDLTKLNPDSLDNVIENFAKIRKVVKGTQHDSLLELKIL